MVSYRTATLISLLATSVSANKGLVARDDPALVLQLLESEDCYQGLIEERRFYPDIDHDDCMPVQQVAIGMGMTEEEIKSIKTLQLSSQEGAAGNIVTAGQGDHEESDHGALLTRILKLERERKEGGQEGLTCEISQR